MNPVCPYCNAEIGPDPAGRVFCTSCGAAHHVECWEENRGCTVFGCSAAPPEEPKLTVGPADLQFSSAAAPPPPPRVYAPPPPFPPDFSLPPPPPPPRVHPPPMAPPERPMYLGGYNLPPPVWMPAQPGYAAPPKSRVAYILLGIFLGIFGAHNFYAGYTARGVIQLCITICTLFVGAIISWIWAIVEVCIVDRDSQNVYMV